MAITRNGTGSTGTATTTSLSVSYPTNAVNDIMLLSISTAASGVTTPSGWTLLGSITTSTTSKAYLYWRSVTAVLSGTLTITIGSAAASKGQINSFSGASLTAPASSDVTTFGFNSSTGFPSVGFTANTAVTHAQVFFATGGSASSPATPTVSGATWTAVVAQNQQSPTGLGVWAAPISGSSGSTQFNSTYSTQSPFNAISVGLTPAAVVAAPVVNAGADASVAVNTAFSRTATETNSPTSRSWVINAGPTGVGSTIGTAAALSWTPTITGTYTLRYSATNSGGTGTDDVIVTVTAASGTAVVASETWTGTTGNPWPSTPNTWTHSQVSGTNGSNTIQTNAGRQTSPSTSTYATYRSYLSSMSNISDCDVTVKFTVPSQVECYPAIGISSDGVAWASDGSYSQNAYQIVMQFTTTATTGKLELTRMKNSVQTSMGANVTKTLTAGTQYQVRIQRQGTAVRVRLWPAAQAEPSTWDFNVTETAANMPAAGKVGLNFQSGATAAARTVDWDDLVVTDLNTAAASTGKVKAYVGGTFVAKPVKWWNGTAWVTKPLKRWNGSAWVVTNY